MPRARFAYMPLVTYPDTVPDESVMAAVAFAKGLDCELHVSTFAAKIPRVSTPLGGLLLNVPAMIRTTEENSRSQCQHFHQMISACADSNFKVECSSRETVPGHTGDLASGEARYFDLSLLPWAEDRLVIQDLAQSVVFGAGRPAILVPPSAGSEPIAHVAIAWDGSRVAARALADAMSLIKADTRVTVLTVQDEKKLDRLDIAEILVMSLKRRGIDALAYSLTLDGSPIAEALQSSALAAGANLLVMGGFGHSRLRDFVLGGATKGIFSKLRMPVLLSH